MAGMYDDPYLETCCRAALHRLFLAGPAGRPADGQDGACLARLSAMGLVAAAPEMRTALTPAGRARHGSEILTRKP